VCERERERERMTVLVCLYNHLLYTVTCKQDEIVLRTSLGHFFMCFMQLSNNSSLSSIIRSQYLISNSQLLATFCTEVLHSSTSIRGLLPTGQHNTPTPKPVYWFSSFFHLIQMLISVVKHWNSITIHYDGKLKTFVH